MENRNMMNTQGEALADSGTGGTNAIADLLNDLIETNLGIVNVYETAVERLENEGHSEFLQDAAERHRAFATELTNLVVAYSGTPVTRAGGGSLAKQAWVVLKATVTDGDGPILSEVAGDAEKVLEAYGEAMSPDLPVDVRQLIDRHIREARVTHEHLLPLSASYKS